MACLSLSISNIHQTDLTVGTFAAAILSVLPSQQARLAVNALTSAQLAVSANQSELVVGIMKQAILSVSEVCSVSIGDIVVLAASDGPLRTKDGGYILLDPATNPPD